MGSFFKLRAHRCDSGLVKRVVCVFQVSHSCHTHYSCGTSVCIVLCETHGIDRCVLIGRLHTCEFQWAISDN